MSKRLLKGAKEHGPASLEERAKSIVALSEKDREEQRAHDKERRESFQELLDEAQRRKEWLGKLPSEKAREEALVEEARQDEARHWEEQLSKLPEKAREFIKMFKAPENSPDSDIQSCFSYATYCAVTHFAAYWSSERGGLVLPRSAYSNVPDEDAEAEAIDKAFKLPEGKATKRLGVALLGMSAIMDAEVINAIVETRDAKLWKDVLEYVEKMYEEGDLMDATGDPQKAIVRLIHTLASKNMLKADIPKSQQGGTPPRVVDRNKVIVLVMKRINKRYGTGQHPIGLTLTRVAGEYPLSRPCIEGKSVLDAVGIALQKFADGAAKDADYNLSIGRLRNIWRMRKK